MLLPQNHTISQKRWRPSQQNPRNLVKHLNVSFWTLGHLTHWSFQTPEFSSLPPTAQRKEERGRVMDCSSCSRGYFHICEEPYSFGACEMSPHRPPLQLQVHSKPEGLKQKMGTCVGQATLTLDTGRIQHNQRKPWVPTEFWDLLY